MELPPDYRIFLSMSLSVQCIIMGLKTGDLEME